MFPFGLTEARIKSLAQRTTLQAGEIIRRLRAEGYPSREVEELELMLSSGPEGGAKLGVRMLDNSRVREGFTNRAHVDNLKSALEHPEVVWKDMTKELERGRMVCLGRSVPEDWRRQGVWVSPFGTIPKPRVVPAKHRVIKHLSHGGMYSINERIPDGEGKVPYFGHAVIAKAIIDAGPDCAMTLSDALAAFRHLEVWASDLRLLMMKLEELFYADTRVGFGSKTGPNRWHMLAKALDFVMEKLGIKMLRKTDDFLVIARSLLEAGVSQQTLWGLLAEWGVERAIQKDFGPSRWVVFDGLLWDAEKQTVSIPLEKREALRKELEVACLETTTRGKVGALRSLVGALTSVLSVVPQGKAFLQAGYVEVGEEVEEQRGGVVGREPSHVGHAWMEISPVLRAELCWWHYQMARPEPGPTRPLRDVAGLEGERERPRFKGHCDASGLALAVVTGRRWTQAIVPRKFAFNQCVAAHGMDPEALGKASESKAKKQWRTSSMLLEVGALLLGVRTFGPDWAGGHVTLFSDNMGAGSAWRKRHARHPMIAGLIRVMTHLCCVHDIVLDVVFVKGKDNILADPVSRLQMRRFRARHPTADLEATPYGVHPLADWMTQSAKRICWAQPWSRAPRSATEGRWQNWRASCTRRG